ncbi:MAG: dehydrogenase [Rhodospirillaceae bacterium]|jgi:trimethylamine-N-oxide reductase (cytochrome c)|nr:dehydrogenase [Rhodospirillaceae bacterium]|tara:strand:+ start:1927 stop:4479 length:2553 start_codon:yes stop_codon:yes gene_type:complete
MARDMKSQHKVVYVSHPGSGLARSNFPLVSHVEDSRIVRSLPFQIPEDTRLYEIKTSRGVFTRPRKEVQMPLAFAAKRRIDCGTRVKYPLLRDDWSPDNPNTSERGKSGYSRISWDRALDIIVDQLHRVRENYGSMEPVLVQADGHGHSGYMQSLHFWGHYLFDMTREHLDWGWWTQQVRNPDSWEGYYWGAKHVWGFDGTLGEPYQDAVWDDVLEHAEMVIFSGNDPEATGLGMSGSSALEMPKWLKRAGIKIVAIAPDLNFAAAVHADKWIPLKPNSDSALYLALAHTWIVEGTYDKEYVRTHTIGFEEFERHVRGEDDGVEKTPAWAEKITGVPPHTVRALAREWAAKKTTLSVYFGGPKIRGTLSHQAARLEAYVLAMQGFGGPGRQFLRTGAPSFYKKSLAQVPRYPDVDHHGVAMNPMIEYAIGKGPMSPVFIPRTLATEAIQNPSIKWRGTSAALAKTDDQFTQYRFPPGDDHPGIRMVWNENGSQPGSWGHGWNWLEALRNPKIEMVVGVHPWLENDIPFSDLILPAQTNYEHEDLVTVQRSDVLAMFYQDQAIEPVGESKSDYEIHRMIGQRLGLDEAFPPVDDWLKAAYEGTLAATKHEISWEEFKEKKFIVYDCPTWDEWVDIKKEHGLGPNEGGLHPFWATASGLDSPSGKIEFVSSGISEHDPENAERPPLAKWTTHPELPDSPKAEIYPLTVMSNHPRFRFHVQGDDIDWIREISKIRGPDGYLYEPCWIHPSDAKARGLKDGDIVKVLNERGAVLVGAKVTQRIIPGALSIDHGAKMDLATLNNELVDRGGCINLISPSAAEKYEHGAEVGVPEMNVSGFLVEAVKVNPSDIVSS